MSKIQYRDDITGEQILAIPMDPATNDAGADTIRWYLAELLATLWEEGEGFSGKRPFGNSGWEFELHIALGKAGLIDITLDEDGYIEECDDAQGRWLINKAIEALRTPINQEDQ